jgi:hypothetical protein
MLESQLGLESLPHQDATALLNIESALGGGDAVYRVDCPFEPMPNKGRAPGKGKVSTLL